MILQLSILSLVYDPLPYLIQLHTTKMLRHSKEVMRQMELVKFSVRGVPRSSNTGKIGTQQMRFITTRGVRNVD